ncbi:putative photosystem II PsbY [Rosa chinensis]|uniref:Putative photosystem II PsbY n=1 Tax=Rosa chinensis TaxID=74649 RepID=A0A2P6P5D3_ROSCH|nr:putative photosystem II PsbY [Rosa chinensis]
MASSLGTMAMLNVRSFTIKSSKNRYPCKPTIKTVSLLSHKDQPISFTTFKSMVKTETSGSPSRTTAITGTILSTLISSDPALSAQRVADGDNRALALLLPVIPAILWVLYNILEPALNQINRMQSEKGVTSQKRK